MAATAYAASLPSSHPQLVHQNAMDFTGYPVVNLTNIFSHQFPPPPPISTHLESLALEPLDNTYHALPISDDIPPPAPQLPSAMEKLNTLKSLMREFNYTMFTMPIWIDNSMVTDATTSINAIIDTPIQSEFTIYRPPQDTWVPLFDRFITTMEQMPNGPMLRDMATDIECAFTSVLSEIENGNISHTEYTMTMFSSS